MHETDEVSGLSHTHQDPPCTTPESLPVGLPSPSSSRLWSVLPSRLGKLSPASKDFSITRSLLSKDRSLERKHGFTSEEGRRGRVPGKEKQQGRKESLGLGKCEVKWQGGGMRKRSEWGGGVSKEEQVGMKLGAVIQTRTFTVWTVPPGSSV